MSERLHRLAYRLLGSSADAEDIVQEANLRLHKLEVPPRESQAWLFRVVTNLALDALRREQTRRRNYIGPWLPEPIATQEIVETEQNLSIAFITMLERLSPAERAAFVLKEGFDLSFAEIADLVNASPATCRQRYHRAKNNLDGEPRYDTSAIEQRKLLDALMTAVINRDFEAVAALFTEDAVVLTDGGGIVSAAIAPVTKPKRIATVFLHLTQKNPWMDEDAIRYANYNGGLAMIWERSGTALTLFVVEGLKGRISRLFAIRNPQKLRGLSAQP